MKCPRPADIKYMYQSAHPNGHFFDRRTMRFFGDSMSNFRARWHESGKSVWLYRARKSYGSPVGCGEPGSGYVFTLSDCETHTIECYERMKADGKYAEAA